MVVDHTRRDLVVSFRLTPFEAAHLDAAGRAMSRPRQRADFARAAALYAAKVRVPEPSKAVRRSARHKPTYDIELLAKILGQLGKVVTDLAQLKAASGGRAMPTPRMMADLSIDMIEIRNAVRAALDRGHTRHDHGGIDGHQG
jgi:hypothetical protein